MIDGFQRSGLLLLRPQQRQANVSMAMIGRKQDFRDVGAADTGIGHFVSDQLFQLLANAFRETFDAVGVQVSEYNS